MSIRRRHSKRSIILLTSLFFFASTALLSAAEERDSDTNTAAGKKVGLGFTTEYLQIKDSLIASIRHQGLVSGLEFLHEKGTEEVWKTFRLNFRYGTVSNRYDAPAITAGLGFQYGYAPRSELMSDTIGGNLYVGGSFFGRSDLDVYVIIDESHGYWVTRYGFGFYSFYTREMESSNLLLAELNIPLLMGVSRPESEILRSTDSLDPSYILELVHKDMQLRTPLEHFALQGGVGYEAKISGRYKNRFWYRIDYTHDTEPEPISRLSHSINFSISRDW